MGNIIKGDELMLFKGSTALAYATSHTLTITGNTIDISSKDHGYWGASEIGNITWEITSENLYTDNNYDELFSAMIAKEPINVVFAKASNYNANGLAGVGQQGAQGAQGALPASWTKGTGYGGQAVITNLTANANTGENATYSVTLTGYGALTKQTVS